MKLLEIAAAFTVILVIAVFVLIVLNLIFGDK